MTPDDIEQMRRALIAVADSALVHLRELPWDHHAVVKVRHDLAAALEAMDNAILSLGKFALRDGLPLQ